MKSYQAADAFTDPHLEISLLAAVAADPAVYWAVLDIIPDGAFGAYGDLWRQIGKEIEEETTPPPVVREVERNGARVEEPVTPVADPEAAARRLTDLYQRRRLADVCQTELQRLHSEDPASALIAELETKLAEVNRSVQNTREGSLVWADSLVDSVLEDAEATMQRQKETGATVAGLSTGLPSLDATINGLGEAVYLLAGPPGYGKTSLGLQIASTVAEHVPVIYFTFENSPANLVLKCMCRMAGISASEVERGAAKLENLAEGAARFRTVAGRIALVEGGPQTSPAMIRGKAVQALHRHEARQCLIVIDYLQQMAHRQTSYQSLRESVGNLSLELRDIARRLSSPVLAISSQSRQAYRGGRSSAYLDTLKESGDLEYSADVVMFLQDSDQVSLAPANRSLILRVAKNRYGQADIDIPLIFKPAIGEFREIETSSGRRR